MRKILGAIDGGEFERESNSIELRLHPMRNLEGIELGGGARGFAGCSRVAVHEMLSRRYGYCQTDSESSEVISSSDTCRCPSHGRRAGPSRSGRSRTRRCHSAERRRSRRASRRNDTKHPARSSGSPSSPAVGSSRRPPAWPAWLAARSDGSAS